MRIIQGRDYYDNALAFGRDETIVFVRQKELFLPDKEIVGYDKSMAKDYRFNFGDKKTGKRIDVYYRQIRHHRFKNMSFDIHPIILLFCGKVYHGLRTDVTIDSNYLDREIIYHWTEESFVKWMDKIGLILLKLGGYWFDEKNVPLSTMFEIADPPKSMMDWMIAQKVVHAIRAHTERWFEKDLIKPWAINSDGLKDIQFVKVIDPYAAFQEISMWIGMTLTGTGNEMVAIKDDMRAQKHGYDKWSFRKMSEGK